MRPYLCTASMWINRITGGEWPDTLCARMARTYGTSCIFCRLIGWILSEPFHCIDELIYAVKSKRGRHADQS